MKDNASKRTPKSSPSEGKAWLKGLRRVVNPIRPPALPKLPDGPFLN